MVHTSRVPCFNFTWAYQYVQVRITGLVPNTYYSISGAFFLHLLPKYRV